MTSITPDLTNDEHEAIRRRALHKMRDLARFAEDHKVDAVPLGLIDPLTKRQFRNLSREQRLERLYLNVHAQIAEKYLDKRATELESRRRAQIAANIARAAARSRTRTLA